MTDKTYSMIVLYKPGALSSSGVKALRKAGYTPISCKAFADVQFRCASGLGIEDDLSDMQLMILKAALDQTYFGDSLGKQIVKQLRAKVAAKGGT